MGGFHGVVYVGSIAEDDNLIILQQLLYACVGLSFQKTFPIKVGLFNSF